MTVALFVIGDIAMPLRSRHSLSVIMALMLLALLSTRMAGAVVAPSPVVLINEFLPNTGNDTVKKEWVELFNPNPVPVELTGWQVDDDTTTSGYTTISSGITIPSDGLLVITTTGMQY